MHSKVNKEKKKKKVVPGDKSMSSIMYVNKIAQVGALHCQRERHGVTKLPVHCEITCYLFDC